MSKACEKVIKELEARRAERETAYADLVRSLARGSKVKVDAIEAILGESARCAEDLTGDVENAIKRIELAKQLATVPALQRREASLVERIDAADRELEVANERHRSVVLPLASDLQDVRGEIRAALGCEKQLQDSAPVELKDRIAALNREMERLAAERQETDKRADGLKAELANAARRRDKAESCRRTEEYRGEVEALQARLSDLQAQFAESTEMTDQLVEQRSTIYAQMLEP